MEQNPILDTPQSIYHTFQLFEKESSSSIFIFKSCFEKLSETFSKKNTYFNINENINKCLTQIDANGKGASKDNNGIYISGFNGTQKDSISVVNQTIERLGEFSESMEKLSHTIDTFLIPNEGKSEKKQSKKKSRKSKDSVLFDDLNEKKGKMLLIYNSIMGIQEHLTTLSPEKEKKAQKLLKKIDEKKEKGHCKPTTATKIVSDLNDLRSNPERSELLRKLNEYYAQYHEHMPNVVKSFCVRYKFIKKMIKKYQKKTNELITDLTPLVLEMSQKVSEINFQRDFSRFVEEKKIIRYDLKCEAFKPIDMSHPVFNNFEPSKIHNIVAVPPVYPILMAKVTNTFTAKYANEITIVKGKMVLLMEPIDDAWVLIKNPFTNQIGFVPAMNLEVIGSALGIITKEALSMDGINLLVGDYVAILKMRVSKDSPFLTHSPTHVRRKSTMKRTTNGSSNFVFGSSNYNSTNEKEPDFDLDAEESPKKGNNDIIEIEDEYDIDNDDDDGFIDRLDDGRSRSIITVMDEKTSVDLENVGIIYYD